MAEGKPRFISSTEYSRNHGHVMHEVVTHRQTVIVTAHGRSQIALLSVTEYEELMEAKRQLAWQRLSRLTTGDANKTPM